MDPSSARPVVRTQEYALTEPQKKREPLKMSRAEKLIAQAERSDEREREQAAAEIRTDAKIARLRELRLAKEAADTAVEVASVPIPTRKPKAKRAVSN